MTNAQAAIDLYTPVATVDGGVMGSINNGLDSALNLWGKFEAIKAQKSAAGGDQITAKTQPELTNGAAVQVDGSIPQLKQGFKVDKPLLYVSLGLLGLAFIMRMKGFR